jgi:hypothetical protein
VLQFLPPPTKSSTCSYDLHSNSEHCKSSKPHSFWRMLTNAKFQLASQVMGPMKGRTKWDQFQLIKQQCIESCASGLQVDNIFGCRNVAALITGSGCSQSCSIASKIPLTSEEAPDAQVLVINYIILVRLRLLFTSISWFDGSSAAYNTIVDILRGGKRLVCWTALLNMGQAYCQCHGRA